VDGRLTVQTSGVASRTTCISVSSSFQPGFLAKRVHPLFLRRLENFPQLNEETLVNRVSLQMNCILGNCVL
jgi:hypothetical protein